ncbi:MAG: tRNA 2-thiouridine(34) synthase MnmA [Flavobacteriales bacterium]|nr:tRNA 2-thiouridine(34) synthase MnmA [Flavobacteriales bacterium]
MKKRVVVGLSGGVDSSVAARLLIDQGYDVVGIFMRNWHDESVTINNECPWIDDSNDAMLAAEHLGIPFQVLDLSAEYKNRIVDYMFAEYKAGRTPNPDILCNREIKFDVFLKAALNLKADFVATGHYARKDEVELEGQKVYRLLAGADPGKDQSYFLCQLNQHQLSRVLFPIGHLQKSQVRDLAREYGLPNAEKKDSQGLCFVGKIKLPVFLQQFLEPKEGVVIEIPAGAVQNPASNSALPEWKRYAIPHHFVPTMGVVVGKHKGAHNFTIGQRKGLQVGGKAEPLFILDIDPDKNIVYTGMGESHPGLYRRGLFIHRDELHWVRPDKALGVGSSITYQARIRYRQPLVSCTLYMEEEGLYLLFDEPQRGIARGQFAAWYDGDELVGSGVIGGN